MFIAVLSLQWRNSCLQNAQRQWNLVYPSKVGMFHAWKYTHALLTACTHKGIATFLAWWRWSQYHWNIAIKDSEQFWAVHVRILSRCIKDAYSLGCSMLAIKLSSSRWIWCYSCHTSSDSTCVRYALCGVVATNWLILYTSVDARHLGASLSEQ